MKVLVVDDEPLARARISNILRGEAGVGELRECQNGLEAVEAIRSWDPDVVFLDIQMPGLDGMGVVETIGAEGMPVTVFVTAFDEFAIRAFDAHALDYLLKPFEPERLRRAFSRARDLVSIRARESIDQKLADLLAELSNRGKYPGRFAVRNGARITFVEADQIDWVSAEGNYVGLHSGRKVHLIRGTLSEFESRLDPERFIRIHRSTIVNIGSVRAVESLFRGEYVVTMSDGTKLNSSSSHRERLEAALLTD